MGVYVCRDSACAGIVCAHCDCVCMGAAFMRMATVCVWGFSVCRDHVCVRFLCVQVLCL